MGDAVLPNIGLIRRIEQDKALIAAGVVNPALQLGAAQGRACGIVRQAQVDNVGPLQRQGRNKTVFSRAGQIDDARPAPFSIKCSGAASHHIGIHIHRVYGVGHGDDIPAPEQFLKIAEITLRPVADENVIGIDLHATRREIPLRDGLAQEAVTLFRTVATEALRSRLLIHGLMQRLDDRRRQRTGYVTDPKADELHFRVIFLKRIHLVRDIGKKIAARQLEIVIVDLCHLVFS